MDLIFIVILIAIILVSIAYKLFLTVKTIKRKRQTGKDIRQKNGYYRLVSSVFLKNLPR